MNRKDVKQILISTENVDMRDAVPNQVTPESFEHNFVVIDNSYRDIFRLRCSYICHKSQVSFIIDIGNYGANITIIPQIIMLSASLFHYFLEKIYINGSFIQVFLVFMSLRE